MDDSPAQGTGDEQTPEEASLITQAIARPEALRVRCMNCGSAVVAFARPQPPQPAPPRYVEMAALHCHTCDLILCSRCADTVGTGMLGGGVCPGCGRGTEPADVSELPGTGVRVIGFM